MCVYTYMYICISTVPCHRELMSTSGSNDITQAAISVYSLEA